MDAFLNRAPNGACAFVPAMEALAARLNGTTYEAMTCDPGQWYSGLLKAGRLLTADALVLGFDNTLLAQACGARLVWRDDRPVVPDDGVPEPPVALVGGRLDAAIESLDRLCQTSRDEFPVIAAMTGPVTLAEQLCVRDAGTGNLKGRMVEAAQALCGKRPDLLLFREGPAIAAAEIGMTERKAFNTLRNVARYFDTPTAVYLEGYGRDTLAGVDRLGVDFYFFGAAADGIIPDPGWFGELAARVAGVGVALPFTDAAAALEHARRCRAALPGANLLFTSPGDLDYDTDLDEALAIAAGLRELR